MRHIISILVFSNALVAIGQSPVIGTAQFFQLGQTYIRDNYIPETGFEDQLIQATGPDYTIDLTPLSSALVYGTEEVIREEATGPYMFYPDYYDTANVQITVQTGEFEFGTFLFLEEPGIIRHVGGQPNGVTWMNEAVWMRYPDNSFPLELQDNMTYGFEMAGIIDGEWSDVSGSDEHYVSGSSTTDVDGYGTITMPDGLVIDNTLRIRTAHAYVDSNALFGVNAYNDSIYTWYAEGRSGPLMTLRRGNHVLGSGYVSHLPLTVYRQSSTQSISAQPEVPEPSVFPNPFNAHAVLLWPVGDGNEPVIITDVQGRVVQHGQLRAGRLELNADRFTPGLYLYVIGDGPDQPTAHGRFVVH